MFGKKTMTRRQNSCRRDLVSGHTDAFNFLFEGCLKKQVKNLPIWNIDIPEINDKKPIWKCLWLIFYCCSKLIFKQLFTDWIKNVSVENPSKDEENQYHCVFAENMLCRKLVITRFDVMFSGCLVIIYYINPTFRCFDAD